MSSLDDSDSDISIDPLDSLEAAIREYERNSPNQCFEPSPRESQLLGYWDVIGLTLNRVIGSGIFTAPAFVLQGTKSLGVSLVLWGVGAILAYCGLQVWLEIGLSTPLQRDPVTGSLRSVPRSGGEKNFLEYLFQKPRRLATCAFGIMFLTLGNLAGNAIAFAGFLLTAAGHPLSQDGSSTQPRMAVVGVAIAAISLSVLLHAFSRRGGIIANNLFAIFKVLFLMICIIFGFIRGFTKKNIVGTEPPWINTTLISQNFQPSEAFQPTAGERVEISDVLTSLLYISYAFSGLIQPFYILGEMKSPRKIMPKATTISLVLTVILYLFFNISYFLVLPANETVKELRTLPPLSLPTRFFRTLLGDGLGDKLMGSFAAISIFGNLVVTTFTASRVKQEIAKEGVLPWSRFFATATVTPLAWLQSQLRSNSPAPNRTSTGRLKLKHRLETAPIRGLFLHWMSSVILLLVTSFLRPDIQYNVLITIYAYAPMALVAAFVSGGLLYLKLFRRKEWSHTSRFQPLFGSGAALITFAASVTMLITGLTEHTVGISAGLPYYLLALLALTTPLWGAAWWFGIEMLQKLRGRKLVVIRVPYIEQRKDGEYVQAAEIVDFRWEAKVGNDLRSGEQEKDMETHIAVEP